MKPFYLVVAFCAAFCAASETISIEGPKGVSNISQAFTDTSECILIQTTDGLTYEYRVPDPDNADNSVEGARSILAQLYRANENGVPLRFFHYGDEGTIRKISGVDLHQP
jgi:hypothetical protein